MKHLKYLLWLLLILLILSFLAGVWFFKLRSTERAYPEAPTLTAKVDTRQTADFNENRNAYFGNDEFADFELYPYTFSLKKPRPLSQPKNSYARDALKEGLAYEQSLGTNPFKFGFIGSTDGHNSAGASDEDNYFGKIGINDPTSPLAHQLLLIRISNPTPFYCLPLASVRNIGEKNNYTIIFGIFF